MKTNIISILMIIACAFFIAVTLIGIKRKASRYQCIGRCGRCNVNWSVHARTVSRNGGPFEDLPAIEGVEGHTTMYSDSSGCFPLCEGCWFKLTKEERLPYYRKLHDRWLENEVRDRHAKLTTSKG